MFAVAVRRGLWHQPAGVLVAVVVTSCLLVYTSSSSAARWPPPRRCTVATGRCCCPCDLRALHVHSAGGTGSAAYMHRTWPQWTRGHGTVCSVSSLANREAGRWGAWDDERFGWGSRLLPESEGVFEMSADVLDWKRRTLDNSVRFETNSWPAALGVRYLSVNSLYVPLRQANNYPTSSVNLFNSSKATSISYHLHR